MPHDFDVDAEFATSFGIYITDEKPKTIRFRVSETEAKFIRDLPIHRSQAEEGHDDKGVIFNIFVCMDDNLIMEFCKYGSRLEVLSPSEVRNAVAEQLESACRIYRD